MPSWGVYYEDIEEETHEWVESFTDKRDAYRLRDELQEEIDNDEDAGSVRAIVKEEP